MIDDVESNGLLTAGQQLPHWRGGEVPIAVVMISLNEGHNMKAVLENLKGFAAEVFLVDSYSSDETIDIARAYGVHVVQRKFRGFGDQWQFAMNELPISAPWTMKLDPDERLTDELKQSIRKIVQDPHTSAFNVRLRLWFMGRPLPVTQDFLRGWKTGTCQFSKVLVNEHPLVPTKPVNASGFLEHIDSPNLHHWFEKQNRYSTTEAMASFTGLSLSVVPSLFGSSLQRRMWIKGNFFRLPMRYPLLFLYHLLVLGAWKAGRVGWIWSRLRVEVYRMMELKRLEMAWSGKSYGLSARHGVDGKLADYTVPAHPNATSHCWRHRS